MEIFAPAPDPIVSRAERRTKGWRPCHKILYRGLHAGIMVAILYSAAAPGAAQESTPEIVPLEKKNRAPKKDLGPRALALLKITRSGNATLVPVMIEVNGKFYDAAAYKADPVPMALESGTVYEGEKTGVSAGLFTVNSALHSLAANAEVPWLATGGWVAEGAKPPKSEMKAEAVPKGLETNDEPPRLTKTTNSTTPPAEASSPAAAPAPASPSPTGASKPEEKPEEKKESKSPEQKPASNGTADAAPDAPPKLAPASSDDSYRPRLRRGKPTEPMPDFDVPGYAKPESAKGASANGARPAAQAGTVASPEPVELITAISDADGPDLRSFAYTWDEGVEDQRRKQMLDLAKTQLLAYIEERAKGQIPAAPAPRKPAAGKMPAKRAKSAVQPVFENVQMRTFDLWGSNQPVLVLSADAHLPEPASGAVDLPSSPLQYKVVLVTRTDIYGNLHRLYSGVTDRFHLDVIPQLDLIDAVDADGDGQGELLFHKTTDTTTGYVLYRAASDTLWKMFDTVNPE